MIDVPQAYVETRGALAALVRDLPPDRLAVTVPASPDWIVRDVVAHVAGLAADFAEGSVPPGFDLIQALNDPGQAAVREAITAREVSERKNRPVGEILAEWDRVSENLLPMLRDERPLPGSIQPGLAGIVLVTDLATHAQDVRGALDAAGDRDSAGVSVAFASYAAALGFKLAMNGLPALRLRYGDRERLAGDGAPAATLTGDRFELYRALAGRRSSGQIRSMRWEGDAEPYVDLIPAYGPRSDPLVE